MAAWKQVRGLTDGYEADQLFEALKGLEQNIAWQAICEAMKKRIQLEMEPTQRAITGSLDELVSKVLSHNLRCAKKDELKEFPGLLPAMMDECRERIRGEHNA